jgi:hypothetical protein
LGFDIHLPFACPDIAARRGGHAKAEALAFVINSINLYPSSERQFKAIFFLNGFFSLNQVFGSSEYREGEIQEKVYSCC